MKRTAMIWGIPVLLWLLFTAWYTDFGGPMAETEIAAALEIMTNRNTDAETVDSLRIFMEEDTGRHFIMVNLLQMDEHPPPVDGVSADAETLMGHYMAHMFPQMLSRGSHPVFMASAVHQAIDLAGIENAEHWDSAALVRYRSRRTLMDIILNPEMQQRHPYKLAALAKTIAVPVEPQLHLSDLRFLLGLVLALGAALTQLFFRGRG